MRIHLSLDRKLPQQQMIDLYTANGWSAAQKPEQLYQALINSHTLVLAWGGKDLLGLGNAISDGHLVVYYPHLLVHPEHHGKGIGKMIMEKMKEVYRGFHMHMLTADQEAVPFYEKMGFEPAGQTQAMWIYQGGEH